MRIPVLPAKAGKRWVAEAFTLLRGAAIPLMVVTMCYLLLLMFSTVVPGVGAFGPLLLTPLLSVGLLHAVRAAAEGRTPSAVLLFRGIKDRGGKAWLPLLGLGVLNAASTVLALGVSALIDGGVLFEIASGAIAQDDPRLSQGTLPLSVLVFLAVYTPLQMALWFAPVFVAWHDIPPGKALFFSLATVMRNKWPFLVYGLCWMGVALAASVIVQIVRLVLGGAPLLMSLVLSPISLIVLSALYCSFWPGYRDLVLAATAEPGDTAT